MGGRAAGIPGGRVTVPITLTGGRGLVAGVQMDIVYAPEVVESVTCRKAARLTEHPLMSAPVGDGALRMVIVNPEVPATFADGEVLTCTVTIRPDARLVPGSDHCKMRKNQGFTPRDHTLQRLSDAFSGAE